MVQGLVAELGPWSWWLLGIALLAAELVMPGVFLVWIGAAAIVVGAVSLSLWDTAWWPWQLQFLVFAVLSVIATLVGRRYWGGGKTTSDEPLLNQRTASLVGRTATLAEPITAGQGRIRLDDTFWSVTGPDLPAGARVRVVASTSRALTVEEM